MASLAYQPEAEAWISPQQAAEMEDRDGIKYEWMDGCIYAMAGASPIHNTIASNISGLLFNHLRGKPCQVWSSDMKVREQQSELRAYPDVVVACPPHQWDESEKSVALLNPLILMEILSPSTQSYDHSLKWEKYRRISSLQEFLLIDSDRVGVQHFRRQFPELPERNDWHLHFAEAREDVLNLSSIACHLSLQEIYERVAFASA